MADSEETDLLMYVVQSGSSAVPAQSTAVIASVDKLMSDFTAGQFFEVESFGFSIKLVDDEGKGDKASAVAGAKTSEKEGDDAETSQSYSRWRSLKTGVKPTPPYRAEPDDFSFVRAIDIASPILLQYCINVKRLDKVVMVKRRRLAATGLLTGVFRMEFAKVYIKSLEWMDGDAVKETCKFKFAGLKVTYVKRKPDGSVHSNWPCNWEPATNA